MVPIFRGLQGVDLNHIWRLFFARNRQRHIPWRMVGASFNRVAASIDTILQGSSIFLQILQNCRQCPCVNEFLWRKACNISRNNAFIETIKMLQEVIWIWINNTITHNPCLTNFSFVIWVFVNFPGKTAKIWRKTPELELASVKLWKS